MRPTSVLVKAPKPSEGFAQRRPKQTPSAVEFGSSCRLKLCNVVGRQQMAAFVPPKGSNLPAENCRKVEKVAHGQILEAKILPRMLVLCLDCRFIPAFVVCYF